ncbi:MAG: PEP-CTERM sorting domain-containing protein [Deltaproteobacteria bacterium]|nr:PEP-CTERM sorting domain-containing protein [Deltaproteobacteria bacterium]
MKNILIASITCGLVLASAPAVLAYSPYYLSTQNDATLGGLTFQEDDVVVYPPATGAATMFFDGANFSASENIDALHIMGDGSQVMVISTTLGATLGGVTFKDGDLVRYDPVSNSASLFFEESDHFRLSEDIDALSILVNGHLVFSTDNDATLENTSTGNFSFSDGDLIEYDPVSRTALKIFDQSLFGGQIDIDAVHVQADNTIILSTATAATLGGLAFDEDDLVLYNLVTGQATLLLNGADHFTLQENIDAISMAPIPIPGAMWLFGSGLFALSGFRRKSRR